MCPFLPSGSCTKGVKCSFAHCESQLVPMKSLRKTIFCREWQNHSCPKSAGECRFAHGKSDMSCLHLYKTVLCEDFQESSTCPRDDRCHKAHGDSELRVRVTNCPNCASPTASSVSEVDGVAECDQQNSISSDDGCLASQKICPNSNEKEQVNPSTTTTSLDNVLKTGMSIPTVDSSVASPQSKNSTAIGGIGGFYQSVFNATERFLPVFNNNTKSTSDCHRSQVNNGTCASKIKQDIINDNNNKMTKEQQNTNNNCRNHKQLNSMQMVLSEHTRVGSTSVNGYCGTLGESAISCVSESQVASISLVDTPTPIQMASQAYAALQQHLRVGSVESVVLHQNLPHAHDHVDHENCDADGDYSPAHKTLAQMSCNDNAVDVMSVVDPNRLFSVESVDITNPVVMSQGILDTMITPSTHALLQEPSAQFLTTAYSVLHHAGGEDGMEFAGGATFNSPQRLNPNNNAFLTTFNTINFNQSLQSAKIYNGVNPEFLMTNCMTPMLETAKCFQFNSTGPNFIMNSSNLPVFDHPVMLDHARADFDHDVVSVSPLQAFVEIKGMSHEDAVAAAVAAAVADSPPRVYSPPRSPAASKMLPSEIQCFELASAANALAAAAAAAALSAAAAGKQDDQFSPEYQAAKELAKMASDAAATAESARKTVEAVRKTTQELRTQKQMSSDILYNQAHNSVATACMATVRNSHGIRSNVDTNVVVVSDEIPAPSGTTSEINRISSLSIAATRLEVEDSYVVPNPSIVKSNTSNSDCLNKRGDEEEVQHGTSKDAINDQSSPENVTNSCGVSSACSNSVIDEKEVTQNTLNFSPFSKNGQQAHKSISAAHTAPSTTFAPSIISDNHAHAQAHLQALQQQHALLAMTLQQQNLMLMHQAAAAHHAAATSSSSQHQGSSSVSSAQSHSSLSSCASIHHQHQFLASFLVQQQQQQLLQQHLFQQQSKNMQLNGNVASNSDAASAAAATAFLMQQQQHQLYLAGSLSGSPGVDFGYNPRAVNYNIPPPKLQQNNHAAGQHALYPTFPTGSQLLMQQHHQVQFGNVHSNLNYPSPHSPTKGSSKKVPLKRPIAATHNDEK